MSVRAIAWAFEQDIPCTSRTHPTGAKLVLVALADRADEDGYCWPSVPVLARKCQMGERTVTRLLKRLQTAALIVVESQARPQTGARITNRYRLALHLPTTTPRPPGAELAPAPPAELAPPRCRVGTIPVPTSTSLIRNDPSVDPSLPTPTTAKTPGGLVGSAEAEVGKKDWFPDFWKVAEGRDGKRPLYRGMAEKYFRKYVPVELQPACIEGYKRYLRQCREQDRKPCDPFRFIYGQKGELWREFLPAQAGSPTLSPPRSTAPSRWEPPPPDVRKKLARIAPRFGEGQP